MRINIVTESRPGWILRRISETLKENLRDSYITDYVPDGMGDINLYINYALFKNKTDKIDIGWFTHRENNVFDSVAKNVDYCISMCDNTANLLPKEKTVVIKPCADKQFYKEEIILGCVGRNQKSGRKRYEFIEELNKIKGVKVLFSNQKLKWEELPNFYKSIDYLVVLSSNEGGPIPVLEAIACGKPVIAPDVGWCWDYPVIKYTDFNDLKRIIMLLITPKDCWQVSGEQTYLFCLNAYRKHYEKNK